jgi:hypothetical protein
MKSNQPSAPTSYNPNYQSQTAVVTGYAVPSDQASSMLLVQGQKICNNCHGPFSPPPTVLVGQGAYYRCGNCIAAQQSPVAAMHGFAQVPQSGFYQPPHGGAGVSTATLSVSSVPVAVEAQPTSNYDIPLNVFVPRGGATYNENERVGVCRRCRYTFQRRPGVNDGQAQYFTCERCEPHRMNDMMAGSCALC